MPASLVFSAAQQRVLRSLVVAAWLLGLAGWCLAGGLSGKLVNIEQAASRELDFRLNPNLATAAQLQLLPGVGETLAQRIVDWRTSEGPFHTAEDLLRIPGIGPKKLRAMRRYLDWGAAQRALPPGTSP